MSPKISTLLAALLLSVSAFSGAQAAVENYTLDPHHVNINWHANHFGFSNPSGRFGIVKGTLKLDEAKPEAAQVDVTIDVAGLTTGIPEFDKHLTSKDFLDTAKYPTAIFKSTAVEVTGKDTANVRGSLLLHGVAKPVTLAMKLNKIGMNPINQKKTAGFSGDIVLKRSEFGIVQYVPNVSDEITIHIEAEANLVDGK